MKTEIVEVDLTDETAQNITSDQSLIQEAIVADKATKSNITTNLKCQVCKGNPKIDGDGESFPDVDTLNNHYLSNHSENLPKKSHETAQNPTSDQSLIQEAYEEAKLRAANSAIQEIPQFKIDTAANVQTHNESKNGSQSHIGEPQPSTSGSISNQNQGIKFGRNPNHQQQQNGDSVIKAENFIFDYEDSNVDNKIKTEEVLKTENFENGHDSAAKNLSEVKQEISNRNLENTQVCMDKDIVRKFRLNVLLKVKEGEERKIVEEILRPGDPISLKFSTNDENIRLVMSQSKIQNQDLEFWATFELRCDGFEGFDLERVTNHLTINPINCPRIRSKVGIIHLLNQNRIYNLFFTYTDFLNFPF